MVSSDLMERLKKARSVAVLTGAGVSAESGVATFRGEGGLWKKFKPEELASFDAFMKNPELVWEWYDYRKKIIQETKPNPGHVALAQMEMAVPEFALITQNVDGLHKKAGSRNIIELHGNIMVSRCIRCDRKTNTMELPPDGSISSCSCGGVMRPDVVWFGEMLPQDALFRAFNFARQCDVFFSIGTSAVVHPAASLPIAAKEAGAYIVEINTEQTAISDHVDEILLGKSGEILPKLLDIIKRQ